ncbi:hypothetical protein ASD25_17905 [Brevundimonas sp. Root1423]|nr:hypothetical protein ASD25_17905 [Brevundimonas sp. Root1423]KRA27140.1 hypothetical protein ASD59_07540 [Brevundimonas sp. Root608]
MGFALVKGDETERIGGAAYALVIIAGVMTSDNSSFSLSRWSAFALDVVLLATFLGLGWQSRRSWPMWAGAFQALIVTGHIMVLANLRPPGDAFAAVNNMANYALLISLAVGTFWAWQERRAAGLKA